MLIDSVICSQDYLTVLSHLPWLCDDRMTVNELERIWQETDMSFLKVLCRCLLGGTVRKNMKFSQDIQLMGIEVNLLRFKAGVLAVSVNEVLLTPC